PAALPDPLLRGGRVNSVLPASGNVAARLRAARWATRVQFSALGCSAGIWGAHIPSVKAHYGLSESGLSMALLAMAVGAVFCLVWAGKLVAMFGARVVTLGAGIVICTALALVVTVDSLFALFPVMLAFGGANGLFDVSINAEGTVL